MPQSRLFAETDETTARALLEPLDLLFETEGLPVSAFENPDRPGIWTIAIYSETGEMDQVQQRMKNLVLETGYTLELNREDIPDTDWVAATLEELSSVHAGRFIVHGGHERHVPKLHEIAIEIDAGLAFGTGHHGTTAGCLDMLTRVSKRQSFYNVLDMGTGSGVLAIAAAKSLNAPVLASDIDPVATLTARENTRINGVQTQVACITAAGFTHRQFADRSPFDLVMANILARPLQAIAYDLARHTMGGGTVILSGLLPHQRSAIVASFRIQGLVFEHAHIRDGWLSVVLRKP